MPVMVEGSEEMLCDRTSPFRRAGEPERSLGVVDRYAQWRAGGDVQQVFRNLSPQQREILIGSDMTRPFPYYLCKTCWDLTVPGEEE